MRCGSRVTIRVGAEEGGVHAVIDDRRRRTGPELPFDPVGVLAADGDGPRRGGVGPPLELARTSSTAGG